ncbi:metallophosphoesterase [Pseudobacteriovorax antillogorgiicola]|uniref:Calcineurin-like phosphoesterase n=1 Tax=Pseudobacteriovorax antillogorgiicola TaxID=1513793 RepID=A0A1Y6BIV0_9BACT|nr:metallophosphoesterase [Pseudobacteriovorax antillogorgiicola]TCS55425.1 calcineurin-like phosphoesterase family protein [Pseudobacteriovorax antillogorgiicola]SMF12562.1 Calcineurin-like phosphoesterase [Pseudobacteriovorax antillogorgiicola]
MLEKYLIVSDIAGQYDAFARLREQKPDLPCISVGDAIDKGPQSQLVLDFLIQDKGSDLLLGNHEYLLLRAMHELEYEPLMSKRVFCHFWLESRGLATILSYLPHGDLYRNLERTLFAFKDRLTEIGHLHYLKTRALIFISPGLAVSHAPSNLRFLQSRLQTWVADSDVFLGSTFADPHIWVKGPSPSPFSGLTLPTTVGEFVSCRDEPSELKSYLHVFGHMSRWGYKQFLSPDHKRTTHLCIDSSRSSKITGLVWPQQQVIQERFRN